MAWLSMVFQLVKSFPAIVGALIELKKMWDQYLENEQKANAMKALEEAINVARTKKDTTQLTALVNDILAGKSVTPPSNS